MPRAEKTGVPLAIRSAPAKIGVAMRTFELVDELAARPSAVWAHLIDVPRWGEWNRLVPAGRGQPAVGGKMVFQIRREDGGLLQHHTRVERVDPPRLVVLSATFGHRWLLRMEHTFRIDDRPNGLAALHQHWRVSGIFTPLLWPMLTRAMARFSQFGTDLGVRAGQAA
jgi:hypothetical protein